MNKKVITIFTVLVLLLNFLIPITVVNAANPTIKLNIKADKTVVNSGEGGDITYTVSIETTAKLTGMQINFKVPEGMTFVSTTLNNNLINEVNMAEGTTKFDDYDFTNRSMKLTFACAEGCTIKTGEANIATIKCKINDTSKKADYLMEFRQESSGFIGYQFVAEVDGHSSPISDDSITMDIDTVSVIVNATGIKLNKNNTTINAGETETLTATLIPADASDEIVWESDNNDVAEVNNGIVTAKKVGKATITARTANGKYSATCQVKVEWAHENVDTFSAEASTCLKHGHAEYKKCRDCGEIIEGSDAPLELADHTYVKVPEQKEVHTQNELKNGVKEHYKCSVCNKLFNLDKTEVSEQDLVIKAEHSYDNLHKADEEFHESTCGCGSVKKERHTGGTATCDSPAICDVCKAPYGEKNPDNHNNAPTEVRDAKEPKCEEKGYTGDTYCTACHQLIKKGEDIQPTGHKGGTATCISKAVCTECGKEYGEKDPDNHNPDSLEIRDDVEPTCTEEGYTGDVYCKDCETKVEEGEVIAPLGHKGDATCTVEAECEICGEMYLDPNNQVNTETRNAVEATEEKEGYTGDIYCLDCGELIEEGTVIPKLVPAEKEEAKPTDPTRPETGDNSNIMIWISLLIVSGASLVVYTKCKRNTVRRKHQK